MTPTKLVIIGASWGGLEAVGRILARLPAGFDAPILFVQHRSEQATDLLTELLDRAGPLTAVDVEDKTVLRPGFVFVAPAGYHVLVEDDHLALSTDAAVRWSRPSIDVALESAAASLGSAVVGIVLTGANEDGAAGLAELRRRGGIAIVQDPATSVAAAMPEAARAAASPHVVAELDAIAGLLRTLAPAGVRP